MVTTYDFLSRKSSCSQVCSFAAKIFKNSINEGQEIVVVVVVIFFPFFHIFTFLMMMMMMMMMML